MLKYETYRIEVLEFISSVRQNRRGSWWKVVLVAVEIMPAGSKLPAAVSERISKSGRHDIGAAAPFSTKTSFLQGRTGSSAFTLKLMEYIRSGSTRFAKKLSPCIA